MTNPYLHENGQANLRPSWLCFLDILGFRELLIANEQDRISELHAILSSGRETLRGPGDEAEFLGRDFHALTSFTDNIVVGFPISRDGETESGMVFNRLMQFQLEMVLSGFFVRGGVAVGDAYIDDLAVFGPALLEAYDGESKLARDPRIVLTDSARALVSQHLEYYNRSTYAPQNNYLKRDRDGQWFLDYLQSIIINDDPESYVIDFNALERHRDVVLEHLEKHRSSPKLWSKYEWVAVYHNDFCDRFPNYFDDSHLIQIERNRGKISSILGDK